MLPLLPEVARRVQFVEQKEVHAQEVSLRPLPDSVQLLYNVTFQQQEDDIRGVEGADQLGTRLLSPQPRLAVSQVDEERVAPLRRAEVVKRIEQFRLERKFQPTHLVRRFYS